MFISYFSKQCFSVINHARCEVAKKNNDFFTSKKIWSTVKDELLGCYLKPYTSKILFTRKPLIYVDCFAGKGRFDDGANGSPLIALQTLSECLKVTKASNPQIRSYFIDLNYAEDLSRNLSGYQDIEIISGSYEEEIKKILDRGKQSNIFLYLDPYGIKALDCSYFDYFADLGCNSIELLINMNSFGFLREACHAMCVPSKNGNEFDKIIGGELEESDPTEFDSSAKSIELLTKIAGGEYWKEIIEKYKLGVLDGYEAEKEFAKRYCERLRKKYKYVLNMPIRLKKGQRPKYRMIHATNHIDGCILMFENITKRQQLLGDIQLQGQQSLFDFDAEDEIIDLTEITNLFDIHMRKYLEFTDMNIIIADFIQEHGIVCDMEGVKKIINGLCHEGVIIIKRTPEFTDNGKPSSFMTPKKDQRVELRYRS